jgi:hypothetical protein
VEGLVIFAPALLTVFTAMATMYLTWPRGDFLEGSHAPGWLIVGLIGIVGATWVMIELARTRHTGDGQSCKDFGDWDGAFVLLVLGASVVGGLAWGTAGRQRDSGWFRLVTFAAWRCALRT